MEIALSLVLGVVCGYWLGAKVMRVRLLLAIHGVNKMIEERVVVAEVPALNTQRVNDTIYLYEESTFVCQGASIEEVAQNFLKVRPVKIAIVKHDEKDIWFVDGEVKTSLGAA
jgi:hypothetical protein